MRANVLGKQHAVDFHIPVLRDLKAAIGLGYLADRKPGAARLKVHQDGGGREAVHDCDRSEGIGQGETDIIRVIRIQIPAAEDKLRAAGKGHTCIGIRGFRGFLICHSGRDRILPAAGPV